MWMDDLPMGKEVLVEVLEELAAESTKDEMFWSPYAVLDWGLGYLISVS